jgi:AraC-like DNA-binding protein
MTLLPTPPSSAVALATLVQSSTMVGPNFHLVQPHEVKGAVLSGTYGVRALRDEVVLHASDAVDLHDLVTRVEQRPGVTIQVFLKGSVNATLGGQHLLEGGVPGQPVHLRQPLILMTARTRKEQFERRSQRGDHMRKVSLTMPVAWLDRWGLCEGPQAAALERFAQTHLARCSWTPSAQMQEMAGRLIGAAGSREPLAALFLESYSLELAGSILAAYLAQEGDAPQRRVDPRDLRRMARVEDYLESLDSAAVSLDEIARAAGVSPSTLQRLFQSLHGLSAFEFLRRRNLERARVALDRDGLSVKEAAFLAGYSSAANFSTAFRKHFGRTPRQVRQ